jgi:glutamine cyclotransferase
LIAFAVLAIGRENRTRTYRGEIVNRYPHDVGAYCQGLAYDNVTLYEGTGQYGESELRKVDLATGKVLQQVPLERQHFGEGITIWKDRIYQLTWKSEIAFVYDRATLKRLGTLTYSGQGWGLTHDGTHLIMSDGTSALRFLDPNTFRVVKRLNVTWDGRLVQDLNELEYVGNQIWANVWFKDYILRISPQTGQVEGMIDLAPLFPKRQRPSRDAVLNGIAHDSQHDRLFVTGKNWPTLYEIRVLPK